MSCGLTLAHCCSLLSLDAPAATKSSTLGRVKPSIVRRADPAFSPAGSSSSGVGVPGAGRRAVGPLSALRPNTSFIVAAEGRSTRAAGELALADALQAVGVCLLHRAAHDLFDSCYSPTKDSSGDLMKPRVSGRNPLFLRHRWIPLSVRSLVVGRPRMLGPSRLRALESRAPV